MMNLMRSPNAGRNWEGYVIACGIAEAFVLNSPGAVEAETPSCPAKSLSRPLPVFNRRVRRLVLSTISTSQPICFIDLVSKLTVETSEQEHFRDSSSSNVDDR